MDVEREKPDFSQFPMISDEVRRTMEAELILDQDVSSLRLLKEAGKEVVFPGEAIHNLNEAVLQDLNDVNPELLRRLFGLFQSVDNMHTFKIDGFTLGMGLILRTYDAATGRDLMRRLGSLSPEVIGLFMQTLRPELERSSRETSILEQVVSSPRIPESNVNLNRIVAQVDKNLFTAGKREMRLGAAMTYQFLQQQWSTLFNPNT